MLSTGDSDFASAPDDITVGPLDLGAAANNNSDIVVKLTFNTGFWDGGNFSEEYILENLALEGVVIPEPASLALVGIGGALMLFRRRY